MIDTLRIAVGLETRSFPSTHGVCMASRQSCSSQRAHSKRRQHLLFSGRSLQKRHIYACMHMQVSVQRSLDSQGISGKAKAHDAGTRTRPAVSIPSMHCNTEFRMKDRDPLPCSALSVQACSHCRHYELPVSTRFDCVATGRVKSVMLRPS